MEVGVPLLQGPGAQRLPACSVYKLREGGRPYFPWTPTPAGKGSPRLVYQRKGSGLRRRASELAGVGLHCYFHEFESL